MQKIMTNFIPVKIDVLRPKPSPFKLIRLGGNEDGAYLLPDDFIGVKACFSPGVANRKDFEDELFDKYKIISHMCDYSSDLRSFKSPLKEGQTFKKKWLDINGAQDSISLDEWVQELEPNTNDDLLLQIDIEGAEYRNLLSTSDATLARFRIIVIELHNLYVCKSQDEFDMELGPLLDKLDEYFICVHAHPNNCCGEFFLKDSKLNIPNVHEVTFLRRDRWKGIKMEECFFPMLPHPLDISTNVPGLAPIFLNEYWLESGVRVPESTVKLLSDKLSFQEGLLQQWKSTHINLEKPFAKDLYKLSQYASFINKEQNNFSKGLTFVDLAKNKPFILSSQYSSYNKNGTVVDKDPFFFHTGVGRYQFITIDLGATAQLFELHIKNRSDICHERAEFLFYCLHDQPVADLRFGLAVAVNDEFLNKENGFCITDLLGVSARYVTIYSPQYTMLHFSQIKIMGLAEKKVSLVESANENIKISTVVTSVGGHLQRYRDEQDIGLEWFDACISSWNAITSNVISISEYSLKSKFIKTIQVQHKPAIKNIFNIIYEKTAAPILLINSDILLLEIFLKILPTLDSEILYYGNRTDVCYSPDGGDKLISKGVYKWEFDYFICPISLISSINGDSKFPDFLTFGEPWWDYCLPIFAMANGIPVKKIDSLEPLALHYFHGDKYSVELWRRHGENVLQWLETMRADSNCRIPHFLDQLLLKDSEFTLDRRLQHVSNVMCNLP